MSQNIDSLAFIHGSNGRGVLQIRTSACIQSSLSFTIECWIALVFISQDVVTDMIGAT
jgi:hypothetical protein